MTPSDSLLELPGLAESRISLHDDVYHAVERQDLRLVVKDVHDEGGRQEGSLSLGSSLHDDVSRDGAADELTPDSLVQLSLLQ